jgi:TIR domain
VANPLPPNSVFICYRRADSEEMVDRIYDTLTARFGEAAIFRDIDNIPAGVDFPTYIQDCLRGCPVILVFIGKEWASCTDARGRRRIEDPDDHVRIEVETALSVPGARVIPIFVRRAEVPNEDELPISLRSLRRRNGITVRSSGPDYKHDITNLAKILEDAVASVLAPRQAATEEQRVFPERRVEEEAGNAAQVHPPAPRAPARPSVEPPTVPNSIDVAEEQARHATPFHSATPRASTRPSTEPPTVPNSIEAAEEQVRSAATSLPPESRISTPPSTEPPIAPDSHDTAEAQALHAAPASSISTSPPTEPPTAPGPTDVAEELNLPESPSILAQDHGVRSVIHEARKELADEAGLPLRLLLNFPRVIVAGYSSIIGVRLENHGALPLKDVTVALESNGLSSGPGRSYHRIAPGLSTQDLLEIEATRGGNFVLRCQVKFVQEERVYYARGVTQLTINVVPGDRDVNVNISNIQVVRSGRGANTGEDSEFTPENILNVVPPGAIRTLNDLLNYTLPEAYAAVSLEMDYEVSQVAISRSGKSVSTGRTIPPQFVGCAETGTKLKLEPAGAVPGAIRGIHLVARPEFKLGRSRQESDFLTWFWPRTPENEELTRRLSRVHVVGNVERGRVLLHDAGSTNESTFEGLPLHLEENNELKRRGTLFLGHEYAVDIAPFDTTLPGGLRIENERVWNGPAARAPGVSGCVRFIPTNSEVALYDALWLFTDANFGSSRLNPLVLGLPKIGEVEGRFHYYRGNFWIEAFQGSMIRIGAVALAPNEIAPITSAQELIIAGTAFRVTIEA